jgi:hypothetical protein
MPAQPVGAQRTHRAAEAHQMTPGMQMPPGMVMPDGSTMGIDATPGQPTEAARMVCGAEVRRDVKQVLTLASLPAPTATWQSSTYTCTYRLPMGLLLLAVHQTPGAAAAHSYAGAVRTRLDHVQDLAGLTDIAFGTRSGTVVLVKDSDVLTVDTTGLPRQLGSNRQKRTDLAYELASDILGCWTGDDS